MRKNKHNILPNTPSQQLSNYFSSFFISSNNSTNSSSTLSSFIPPLNQKIISLILSTKSPSPLDPIPLSLMQNISPLLAIYITEIISKSFINGHVPIDLKHALVSPIIKKNKFDHNSLSNHRPISQLSTLSKIMERVVLKQLLIFLENNNLIDSFQSTYRPLHNTQTCITHLLNDIIKSLDSECPTQLLLLDLPAAFNTLDHTIMKNRLIEIGIHGMALDWIVSYFSNRTLNNSNCYKGW